MRLISQRGVHFPPGQPKVDVFFSDSRVRSLYVRTMHCDPYTPPQLGDQQSRTKKPQPAPLGLSDLAGGGVCWGGGAPGADSTSPPPVVCLTSSAPGGGAGRSWQRVDVPDGMQLCFKVTSEPRTATCPGTGG